MWVYLVVVIIVVFAALFYTARAMREEAAEDPYPTLGWQQKKVEDLRRYVRQLREFKADSEAQAEMRAEYLKVAAKKLEQEEEKLKELLIEWDRVHFERMMNR